MTQLEQIKRDVIDSHSWGYYEAIHKKIMKLLCTKFSEHQLQIPEDSPYSRISQFYFPSYDYHCKNFDKMISLLKSNGYVVENDGSWAGVDKGEFVYKPTDNEILEFAITRIKKSMEDMEKMFKWHEANQAELNEIIQSLKSK